ncbi:MAG: hypothetical protein PHH49_02735 [Candidatus Omnitrophica bacterium]|nr:hypothetical protein [Candidatus Omnitrophota bacterium]MDD5487865.1 hypothetical protein [Candidatus Omnitrophota bacterium]
MINGTSGDGKRRRSWYVWIILICGMCASGCAEKDDSEPGTVEYLSGSEQVKVYHRTKARIEDINRTLKERYDEVE